MIGIGIRWYGVDWALPNIFHPDETRLLYAMNDLSFKDGDFDPDFFAYGSLPIYLLKIAHETAKRLISPTVNFFLVGRSLSAFWGSLTLMLLYRFGRRFFSSRVALLGTTFLAFTVLHIQLSHFLTVDVFLTLLVVWAVYWMAALVNGVTPARHYLLSGVAIGLAMATKFSALPLYGALLGAHAVMLLRAYGDRSMFQAFPRQSIFRNTRHPVLWLWMLLGAALLVSALVFTLCQPYAILDFAEFSRQIKEQSDMARGVTQPPYTIQYEGTPAYTYPIRQLLRHSLGIPLGLLVLLGTCALTLNVLLKLPRRPQQIAHFPITIFVILLWVVPVFLVVGGFQVKFLRYMLPLIPFFCLLGAAWVDQLLERFAAWRIVTYTAVALVIGYSAVYALAFLSVYAREDPRVQMSRWLYEHVEPGATVLTELWEFVGLVPVDGRHPGEYHLEGMDLYGPDSEQKLRTLADQLSRADAVILATRRLYGSILRVPERYPLTTRYYRELFGGRLGFGPPDVFVNEPTVLGLTFPDDFADESFSVYDHPKTIIFQKSADLSAEQLYRRISSSPPVRDADQLLGRLLAFPALEPPEQRDGEAAALSTPAKTPPTNGMNAGPAIILWLVVIELLALLALPFSMLLFHRLPDCGYSAAKAFGLLLPGYSAWLLVSLDALPFTRGVIAGVIGGVGALALVLFLRYRAYYAEQFRQKWRVFLMQEGVFLAMFGGFLLFRAYNPDIFWSESSMDFSFLNVLSRTESFPPPDPWFAGAPLNYYYFGHYLLALPAKLAGIAPQVTYNLAFACIPAMVAAGVFSLLYNLTRRCLWGWVGMVFAALLGNLDGFFLLLANWRTRMPALDVAIGANAWLDGLIGTEHYYRIFRPAHEVIQYTVHEFPFWTFLFVDLHAHLLNMPFLLAALLAALHLLASHQDDDVRSPLSATGMSVISGVLLMLLFGALAVISSWDYPTAVIFLLACAIACVLRAHASPYASAWPAWRRFLGIVCLVLPGSVLAYHPFYAAFSRAGMGLGLVEAQTTALTAFVTMFGAFLWLLLGFLIARFFQTRASAKRAVGTLGIGLAATWALWFAGLALWGRNYATLLSMGAVGALALAIFVRAHLRSPKAWPGVPAEAYALLCVVYAAIIVIGCEIVFVRDFLQGGEYRRMNTIFKFYLPVWFFLACAAAYAVSVLWRSARRQQRSLSRLGVRGVLVGGAVLVMMSAVFPVVATYSRRHADFYGRQKLPPTLNGLAFLAKEHPDEYRAIAWLNARVAGTPTIVEAVHDDYRYEYARVSANTGLPTVLGWPSHADQREHWGKTHQRRLDVNEIYTTPDARRAYELIQHYQARYVYIGRTERRDFPEQGLVKFHEAPNLFREVFRSGDTVIYVVQDS